MTQNDGGPAFPSEEPSFVERDDILGYNRGMSLRDYFAAKAVQGLLAQSCGTALESDPSRGAQYAYAIADAMLKARE